jgi:hypothetical protein
MTRFDLRCKGMNEVQLEYILSCSGCARTVFVFEQTACMIGLPALVQEAEKGDFIYLVRIPNAFLQS